MKIRMTVCVLLCGLLLAGCSNFISSNTSSPDSGHSSSSETIPSSKKPSSSAIKSKPFDENTFSIYDNNISWGMTLSQIKALENDKYLIKQENKALTYEFDMELSAGRVYRDTNKIYYFDDEGKLKKIYYTIPSNNIAELDYTTLSVALFFDYKLDTELINPVRMKNGDYGTEIKTDFEKINIITGSKATVICLEQL